MHKPHRGTFVPYSGTTWHWNHHSALWSAMLKLDPFGWSGDHSYWLASAGRPASDQGLYRSLRSSWIGSSLSPPVLCAWRQCARSCRPDFRRLKRLTAPMSRSASAFEPKNIEDHSTMAMFHPFAIMPQNAKTHEFWPLKSASCTQQRLQTHVNHVKSCKYTKGILYTTLESVSVSKITCNIMQYNTTSHNMRQHATISTIDRCQKGIGDQLYSLALQSNHESMAAACRGSADPKLDDIGCCSKQGLCFSISLLPSGS